MYAARHQRTLLTGCFKVPKQRSDFTPGVDSTKRCVLGSKGSPAQWPNCSRLIEAIFLRLCEIHKSPRKQGTQSLSRWYLMIQDYRRIRQLLLGNGVVMGQTTLQPFEVNQTTVIQWHNKRLKGQEVGLLLKGMQLPVARPLAGDPLLPANVQPVVPVQHHHPHQLHTYYMPANTAGQAKTRFRQPQATPIQAPSTSIQLPAPSVLPPAPHIQQGSKARPTLISPKSTAAQRQLFPTAPPVMPGMQLLLPCSVPSSSSASTINHPLSSTPTTATTESTKRKYVLSATSNLCKKCGQFRTTETGHSQYRGKIYCPKTETLTKEEWLKAMQKAKYEESLNIKL